MTTDPKPEVAADQRAALLRLAYPQGEPFSEEGRLHACPVCRGTEMWPYDDGARAHTNDCWLAAALTAPPAPVVETAPEARDWEPARQREHLTAWLTVWDLCEELGMDARTDSCESGLEGVLKFIRSLAQPSPASLGVREAAEMVRDKYYDWVFVDEISDEQLQANLEQVIGRVVQPLEVERLRLVRGIVAAGEAFEERDYNEAYHQLYETLRDVGYSDRPGGTFEAAFQALADTQGAANGK